MQNTVLLGCRSAGEGRRGREGCWVAERRAEQTITLHASNTSKQWIQQDPAAYFQTLWCPTCYDLALFWILAFLSFQCSQMLLRDLAEKVYCTLDHWLLIITLTNLNSFWAFLHPVQLLPSLSLHHGWGLVIFIMLFFAYHFCFSNVSWNVPVLLHLLW